MKKNKIQSDFVPLNLIFDYPVRWSKYKVLRDFIQNFYDSIPDTEWDQRFSFQIEDKKLILEAEDVGFSYDWLVHMGASTKREKPGKYAGYFGEGFKIASLCAKRDHKWNVTMISRNWELQVETAPVMVDGRKLTSLAYRIEKKEKSQKNTRLILDPFHSHQDLEVFESARLSFYYPENPLFGEEIWKTSEAAIYLRSNSQTPAYFPSTYDYEGRGIIYAGYQAMGSLRYPLIFCLHGFHLNDRERNSFYRMDVVKVVNKIADSLPAKAAGKVLEVLRNQWYQYPKEKYDFDSWYSVIRSLAKSVASSQRERKKWEEKYPQLLVAKKVKKSDLPKYNKRSQALAWFRGKDEKYTLVQDGFLDLGYPTLEEVCEKEGGFSFLREPQGKEIKLIELLETLTLALGEDFFGTDSLPPCKIIKTETAVWKGLANCIPLDPLRKTSYGLKVRFDLPYIALKSNLFEKGCFGEALSTFLHEQAHCFGGDRSAGFSNAITEILDLTLNQTRLIEICRKKWESLLKPTVKKKEK